MKLYSTMLGIRIHNTRTGFDNLMLSQTCRQVAEYIDLYHPK